MGTSNYSDEFKQDAVHQILEGTNEIMRLVTSRALIAEFAQ